MIQKKEEEEERMSHDVSNQSTTKHKKEKENKLYTHTYNFRV